MKGKMGLQGVVDNHTIDDSLFAKGWDVTKRALRGQAAAGKESVRRAKRKALRDYNFLAFLSSRKRKKRTVRAPRTH